jgi:hypothetical protein
MMEKVKTLVGIIITTLLISACASPVVEETLGSCSKGRKVIIEKHISKQIDAIADGDWQRAYSFAAASFQEVISIDQFEEVINKQYLYLIFNDGYTFGECTNTEEGINQIVLVNYQERVRTLSYDLTLIAGRLGVVAASQIEPVDDVAT